MISLYNIVSENQEWLLERLDFYVSKVYCLKNTGFVKEKQKVVVSEISDYIYQAYSKNINTSEIASYDENKYRYTGNFISVFSDLGLGINRNNIIRLIKHCKKVYLELIFKSNLPNMEEREICSFLEGFFDNFELNIFDNWYCLNQIKEVGNFTYDEFRDIALEISETAALGIMVIKEKKIQYINRYLEETLEYDIYELQSINWMNLIDKNYHSFLKDRMNLCISDKKYSGKYTVKAISKSGNEKWLDIIQKSFNVNGSNIVLMTIADITDYRQVQDELIRNGESLRTLIDEMTDFVCFKDQAGKWIEVNETAVDLFDLQKIDYKGMTNSELANTNNGHYRDFFNTSEATDENAWKTGNALEYEEIINKPYGSRFIYDIIKVPLYYKDGSRKSIVELGKNVTRRKEAEMKLMESEDRYRKLFDLSPEAIYIEKDNKILLSNKKGIELFGEENLDDIRGKDPNDFFTNISHELRTPLNVLLGTLQLFELMLEKDTIDYSKEKFIRYTLIMKQNCYRLVKTVNNLIDITKIDSGHFPVHMSNNNIVEIVENIVMSIVDYAENKGIKIQFDTDYEEKNIGCDPDKIERIMLNLLSNSIKFTEPGGKIKVNVSKINNKILIAVKDTGIGIPQDKLSEIFDRFVQVDRSLSRINEGSGIGLSMVKSLVEMQGGTISVQSILGRGSDFIVELPDKLVDESVADNLGCFTTQSKKEKIKVEFSDIYF